MKSGRHDQSKTWPPAKGALASSYRRLGSVPAVAREFGVAFETARRGLLAAGIELRPKGLPSESADRLKLTIITKRYESGDSIATIGTEFGVSPATVRARLIEAGVELRPRRGWKY